MAWLVSDAPSQPPGEALAALWKAPGILRIPGAHHPLAGLIARRRGFKALYVSGGALSAMLGLPDLGIVTLEELCFFTRALHRATGLPLVVDADTGYGEALNVMRTVRELEDAGAAGIQIEDQVLPKKCGHLNDKKLAVPEDMAAKVAAARRARRHIRIVARTDAVASEGMAAAIARAQLYVRAGADAVFPEALTTEAMFREFAAAVPVPLLANMTEFGRTPQFTAEQFESFGFRMVIWPATSLRAAARTLDHLYGTLAREGSAASLLTGMQTRAELYDLIGYFDYEAADGAIVRSVLPEAPSDAGP